MAIRLVLISLYQRCHTLLIFNINLTLNLTYLSDWWRMNFFVRFLTIFVLFSGRITMVAGVWNVEQNACTNSIYWSVCTDMTGCSNINRTTDISFTGDNCNCNLINRSTTELNMYRCCRPWKSTQKYSATKLADPGLCLSSISNLHKNKGLGAYNSKANWVK